MARKDRKSRYEVVMGGPDGFRVVVGSRLTKGRAEALRNRLAKAEQAPDVSYYIRPE